MIKGAYLGGLSHCLNHCLCLEVAVAADATNEDGAVFLDFDCGIGLLLEGLDILAARADDFADKFGVDFNGNKFRRINAKLGSGLINCLRHNGEYFEAGVFCLFHCLDHNVMRKAVGFYIKLDRGNTFGNSRDFEIHIAVMVLVAYDIGKQDVFAVIGGNKTD